MFAASAPAADSSEGAAEAYEQSIEADIAKIQKGLEGIIPPEEGTVEVVLDDLGRRAGQSLAIERRVHGR